MKTLAVTVPAKVNLHLKVGARRRDGFHEVRTILQSIDLSDEVIATSAPVGVTDLVVDPKEGAPAGEDNLVLRAASAVRRHTGVTHGVSLLLRKNIPAGAGLGGGSADAAATLVLLDTLWNLDLGHRGLLELAAGLGSDVPFFLHGGTALGRGRGDEVIPLPDREPRGVLVVMVPALASTAAVYAAFDLQLTSEMPEATVDAFTTDWLSAGSAEPPWDHLSNDLESVVVGKWPEVGKVLDLLRLQGPLHAAVTGSGTATFAVFNDFETARKSADMLDGGWHMHVGSTLPRALAVPKVRQSNIRKESRI